MEMENRKERKVVW